MTIDPQCLDCQRLTGGCWRHSVQVDVGLPPQSTMLYGERCGRVLVQIGDEDVERIARRVIELMREEPKP